MKSGTFIKRQRAELKGKGEDKKIGGGRLAQWHGSAKVLLCSSAPSSTVFPCDSL